MSRGPNRTVLNRTRLNRTVLNRTVLNRTVLNRTVLNGTRLNRTGLNRTGLNRTGLSSTSIVLALLELSDVFFNPLESFFVRRHTSLYSFCKSADLLLEQLERVLFWDR
jgi:uncharacterized protein YjbI with pentapeptide repeats